MEKFSVKEFITMRYYCTYPYQKKDNPFLKLLKGYLNDSGWNQKDIKFRTLEMFKYRKQVNILWFHWPNSIWRDRTFFQKYFNILRFVYHVYLAKFLGYKLVWSVHNVLPHGEHSSKLEFLMRKFLANNFHLFIGHANNTFKELKRKNIIPKEYALAIHGHYENEYKAKNKAISRKLLGVDEDDIVILIKSGGKNFDSALKFAKNYDSLKTKRIKLLVLGSEISDNENVVFIPGFASNEDLSSYIELSDFIALPYEEITTSGAYFLAITFGKPVIAKKLAFFIQHGGDKSCLLYEDFKDLNEKLRLLDNDKVSFNKQEILNIKNLYTWEKSSKNIIKAFNRLYISKKYA